MHIIIGAVLLIIGIKLIYASARRHSTTVQINSHVDYMRQEKMKTMELQLAALRLQKSTVDLAVEKLKHQPLLPQVTDTVIQPKSIDSQVVFDSMARENRAKAALIAVMKQNHCSQDQIDEAIRTVDNGQDGDC